MPKIFDDLTGRIFGRQQVLEHKGFLENGVSLWLVRCLDCGNEREVQKGASLKIKHNGCRCWRRGVQEKEFVGVRVGESVVEAFAGKRGDKQLWRCRCACGDEMMRTTQEVRSAIRTGRLFCMRCARRMSDVHVANTLLVNQYRSSAGNRGLAWELSDEQVVALTARDCHYCGTAPQQRSWKRSDMDRTPLLFHANGIDRVDPKKGYVPGNIVPCCADCNTIKSDLTLEQLLALVTRIARHQLHAGITYAATNS